MSKTSTLTTLKNSPVRLRSSVDRSVPAGAISRSGGDYDAGYIGGVSLITRGEALGHGMWLDRVFIQQVRAALEDSESIKSRFTHPNMSGDGLARRLGRVRPSEGMSSTDQVFGDMHFQAVAFDTPDGNLGDYVLRMAEEDPDSFGLSIVFMADFDAMQQFEAMNIVDGRFQSPDADNQMNYPHARLAELSAADFVDDPAANPGGLFSRDSVFRDAEAIAEFAFGIRSDIPAQVALDLDPSRAKVFLDKFLNTHGLEVVKMSDATTTPTPEPVADLSQQPATIDQLQAITDDSDFIVNCLSNGVTLDSARDALLTQLRSDNGDLTERIAELETTLAERDEELAKANATLEAYAKTEPEPVKQDPGDGKKSGLAGRLNFASN